MKKIISAILCMAIIIACCVCFAVCGEEKKKLTVEDLLTAFSKLSGTEFSNDRALLN